MKYQQSEENQVKAMLQKLNTEVLKGIRHGHFEFSITCQGSHINGKRTVDLKTGLSHRYTFDFADIPRQSVPQLTFQPKAEDKLVQPTATSQPEAPAEKDNNNERYTK
jgi:hypothetical protein